MDKHAHTTPEHHLPGPNPGHETSDVYPRPLVKTAGVMAGLVLFSILGMVALYKVFDHYLPKDDKPRHPMADSRFVSTAPRLQPDPPALKEELRQVENQVLGSYDWTDKEKRLVRIPIDRAIELVALQQKLPVFKASDTPAQ
ncbi:MAG: hypothetical protein IT369_21270 [Candidatus Latescibacteria bacterium]|nr:hypothetical protein [Candidatus Latescibacterota bacterium]